MGKTHANVAAELITRSLGRECYMLKRAEDRMQELEKALQDSDEHYRSVVENIGIGVSLISPEMEILSLNKQMQAWFPEIDVTARPICYQSFNDPPREQVCSYCPTRKTLKDGAVHENTTDTPRGDRVVNYRIISSPIKDEDENVIAAIEMVEDVTERRRMEAALAESKKKYKELAKLLPQTVFELDKDGNVTFANAYGFVSTGYTKTELKKGLHASALFIPEDRVRATENLWKAMSGDKTDGNEYTIRRKDGSTYPAVIYSSPIVRNNRRVGLRGIVVDITKRKKAERALQKRDEELQARNRELEEVNTALKVLLKRREEDKKELEEKVLSNMKNLVLPHIERLKESNISGKQMHYLETLEANLNQIISPFSHTLTTKYMNLSFVETQVANYVKEGKRTKEIAELMNLSTKTIDSHRKSIRRKLGLTNGKNNLRSFLLSIDE
jgi:PAS domain S-box-containing protein